LRSSAVEERPAQSRKNPEVSASAEPSPRKPEPRKPERQYLPLFQRVVAANALLLVAACLVTILVLSPRKISSFAFDEAVVLGTALALVALVNVLLVRRVVAPLQALTALARRVNLSTPGQRIPGAKPTSEAGELALTFNEMLARLEQERRESTRRVLAAHESERLRIAQELHDVVAHHMSLINVQAGVALHLSENQRPEQVEPALRAIKDASKEALTELRSLIDVLRADGAPAPRAPQATLAGLDDIVERSGHAGLAITKTVTGRPRVLPAALELAAYRIVQEAVTNIVRHAHASRATVDVDYGDSVLTVRIEDDGTGARSVQNLKEGNGIGGMRERARALGGELEVQASELSGLRVEAHIPTGDDQ
jgi:signal transduction histidine kinase